MCSNFWKLREAWGLMQVAPFHFIPWWSYTLLHGFVIFVNMDFSFSIFGSVHILRLGGASFLFSFYTLTILNSRHKERRWLSIHCERDLKKSTALLPNLRNIFFSCLKFNHAFLIIWWPIHSRLQKFQPHHMDLILALTWRYWWWYWWWWRLQE